MPDSVMPAASAIVHRSKVTGDTTDRLQILADGTFMVSTGSGTPVPFRPITETRVNIKDPVYGAKGDGVTDDRAAFQLAITLLNLTSGGTIVVPVGTYNIGSPGLVWPTNAQKSISLVGESLGSTAANSRPTTLVRTGNWPIITTNSTGTGDSTITHAVNLRDIALDGGSFGTNPVCAINGLANSHWSKVTILSATGSAILGKQLWNVYFDGCYFVNVGDSGSGQAAIALTDNGTASSGTNTVHFIACEWEGNAFDDLRLSGPNQGTTGVMVAGCKFERNGGGPAIRDLLAGGTYVTGSVFFAGLNSAGGTVDLPCIIQSGGTRLSLTACGFAGSSASNPTNLVQLATGGNTSITNCTFLGGLNHVRIESGFGSATIVGNQSDQFNTPTMISDARSAANRLGITGSNGRIAAYDGLTTKIKAGTPVDGDFTQPPGDGTIVVDTTANKIWARVGGVWKGVVIA